MLALRLVAVLVLLVGSAASALAQAPVASQCLLMAQNAARVVPVAYVPAQALAGSVTFRFVGHSTFRIESPDGTVIATDYHGNHGGGSVPDVVTMNRAHSTHYTDFPDPAIAHVLRGWNPSGGAAEHEIAVGDVLIRSVPTDIRALSEGRVPDGNSIFIFETADLCIGHLGHLHQVLNYEDLGWIGQLDIVMVAVDGAYTMSHQAVAATLDVLSPRLVLPMHYFGGTTLERFLAYVRRDFEIEMRDASVLTVSRETLPRQPTVVVLPGY